MHGENSRIIILIIYLLKSSDTQKKIILEIIRETTRYPFPSVIIFRNEDANLFTL